MSVYVNIYTYAHKAVQHIFILLDIKLRKNISQVWI